MQKPITALLGCYIWNPKEFAVTRIDDNVSIGISSVVTRREKPHNKINNEDAVGYYLDAGLNIAVAMVADAHFGHITSHEAVRKFPDLIIPKVAGQKDEFQVKQGLLEAAIELSDYIDSLWSRGRSATTFHCVLRIGHDYYRLSIGDSFTSLYRDNHLEVQPMDLEQIYFLGENNLRTMILKQHPDYLALWENLPGPERSELEFKDYTKNVLSPFLKRKDIPLTWDLPYVQKVVKVEKLNTRYGDIIFMCSDAIDLLKERTKGKVHPLDYVTEALKVPPYEATVNIMQAMQDKKFDFVPDNIVTVAWRVNGPSYTL